MIIFGTKGITTVQQKKGSFHCPACGAGADFEKKDVRRWFTLFFIPCIPLHKAAEYVECKRCGGNFKPEVLGWNGVVPGQSPPPIPPPVDTALSHEFAQLRPSLDPKTGMPLAPPLPPSHGGSTVISYQSNGLATASLVLGILGLVTSFLLCPGFIFVPLSLLFGIIALVKVKNGNGLVGGKGVAKAGIACSLLAILAMGGVMVWARNHKPSQDSSEKEPWRQAASHVAESSTQTAWGNTPEATDLAAAFAKTLSAMHSVSFTGKRGREVDSRFVVHCELIEGKCAFLVCVPDYRKYKGDTRDSLNKLVWLTATSTAAGKLPENTSLCVALKGLVMFGDIMTGPAGGSEPQITDGDTDRLKEYFPAATIKVTPGETGTEPVHPREEENHEGDVGD